MSAKPKADVVGRRGELIAEIFLQDLGAEFVARPTADLGYDFFVGFNNSEGGVNLAAVEVKATDRPVLPQYRIQKRLFRRLANSNIPVLLLVADVKENRLYYALLGAHPTADETGASTVAIAMTPVNESTREELRHLLGDPHAAASGVLH